MGKILAVATHATDDQTKSTGAFITAIGALGAGKEVGIVLFGEAVYLAKETIAKSVHGVGFPPLSELIEKVVEGKVPVYVWGACSVARGVTEDDLKTLNATFIDPIKFAYLVAESNVVSFWCSGNV